MSRIKRKVGLNGKGGIVDRIEVLNRVKRPVGFSPREFDETREILRSIWRGEVSVSMSGIEEYADLAHRIMSEMTKLRWLYSRTTHYLKEG